MSHDQHDTTKLYVKNLTLSCGGLELAVLEFIQLTATKQTD